jgi:hypothetical protein
LNELILVKRELNVKWFIGELAYVWFHIWSLQS